MRLRALILVPSLLSAALLLAGCGREAANPAQAGAEPSIALIDVARVAQPRERAWDGVVEAIDQATLAAQTGGRVLALPFDVNDVVEAGQVVVRFTDVEQQSGQRRAEAQLAAARAAANEAEADFRRISELSERQLVARAQLDQASARRDAARAQLSAAEAAVREAREQVDYTVVRAPYTGILTQRFVEVGETVRPGQPLVAGLALNRLRVHVDVPQGEVDAIRRHRRAHLLLDDGRRVEAAEVVVFPYADPQTHSFRVRIELPEAETGLYPGMIAKVAFVLDQGERLLVPSSALVQRSEVAAVYAVDAQGRIGLRQVRPGHRFDDRVEILAGLAEGERIAADPLAALAWLAEQRGGGHD